MYKLFLDDERTPQQVKWIEMPLGPWEIVRSYAQFVSTIKRLGLPLHISFDHDLAPEHYRPSMYNKDGHYSNYYNNGTFKEKTGYHCAKWLTDYCMENNLDLPTWTVHSMNPIGVENINSILNSYEKFRKTHYEENQVKNT